MATPLAIFTADWHVRKYDRVWGQHPGLYGDTTYGIEQILHHAMQLRVPYLLLGGDNFEEKTQRSDAATRMRQCMDTLRAADIGVWYIQGQHELTDPPFVNGVHSWPQHLHGRTVTLDDVQIYGLDYQRPNNVEAALGQIPRGTQLLLTHQVWRNVMGEDRGEAWAHWINRPVTILSGDYHRRMEADWVGRDNVPLRFISPGPVCMQKSNEPEDHWAVLLNTDLSYQWLPLRSRPTRELRISTADDLAYVLDTQRDAILTPDPDLPPHIQRPLVRVYYSTGIEQCRARIAHAFGADAFLFWFPQASIAEPQNAEAAERISTVLAAGLPGTIRRLYNDDPQAATHAVRLLDAADYKHEMQQLLQELTEDSDGTDDDGEGPLQESSGGENSSHP